MRVHLTGVVSLNGGDAAITEGETAILTRQWPGATVTVADTHPRAAARYLPGHTYVPMITAGVIEAGAGGRLAPARRTVRKAHLGLVTTVLRARPAFGRRLLSTAERACVPAVLDADVVAYTGGTSLTDNYVLAPKLAELTLARRLGIPYVVMQCSAGPFRVPANREALRPVFAGAALVLLREARSLRHVVDVGADPDRCAVLPDAAFALAPQSLPAPHPVAAAGLRIVVSVRDWSHFATADAEVGMSGYLDAVATAVTAAVRDLDAEVVFSSTCQGRPEYWTDDCLVADRVVARLEDGVRGRVTVDRRARTPRELIGYLGGFDAMVSTRLHGAILAACAGVPTLAIAYEYKTTEVFDALGLADWVVDINGITGPLLAGRLTALVGSRAAVRAILGATLPVQRDGALAAGPLIAAAIR